MEDYVYSSTLLWQLLGSINDFAGWFIPFFLVTASLVWALKEKTKVSYIALFGGTLAFAARITHWLVPNVSSIALGYPEPSIEQNPTVWFLYVQALNIGSFIFVVCVGYRFTFQHKHKK